MALEVKPWVIVAGAGAGIGLLLLLSRKSGAEVIMLPAQANNDAAFAQALAAATAATSEAAINRAAEVAIANIASEGEIIESALSFPTSLAVALGEQLKGISLISANSAVESHRSSVEERAATVGALASLARAGMQESGTIATSAISADAANTQAAILQSGALQAVQTQSLSNAISQGIDAQSRTISDISSAIGQGVEAQAGLSAGLMSTVSQGAGFSLAALSENAARVGDALSDLARTSVAGFNDLVNTAAQYNIAKFGLEASKELESARIASASQIQNSLIGLQRNATEINGLLQQMAIESNFYNSQLAIEAGVPFVPGDYSSLFEASALGTVGLGQSLAQYGAATFAQAGRNFQVERQIKAEEEANRLGAVTGIISGIVRAVAAYYTGGASEAAIAAGGAQ